MSFNELIDQLPSLSILERQQIIRRALELDDPDLTSADEALIEKRLAEHRQNPASAVTLDEMNSRLRSRFQQ